MVKQMEKDATRPPGEEADQQRSFVQISIDDFLKNDDGTWVAVKEVVITGPSEAQTLIKEGRQFGKGEMMLFGMDLAAILERHCPQ
jgi:hypothetical protein